ncbi:hypothetical protein PHAVU_003G032800, partial [Phaseolus vulgaris]
GNYKYSEYSLLFKCFTKKVYKIFPREKIIKYLHARVCCVREECICTCEWNERLLSHFEICTNDDCLICERWKEEAHIISKGHLSPVKRKNDCPSEVMLPLTKRRKVESETECKVEQITTTVFDSGSNTQIMNGIEEADNMLSSEEPTKNHDDLIVNEDAMAVSDSHMETSSNTEEIEGKSGFNQDEFNATEEVIEPKSPEKEMKTTNPTANTTVSSTESLARSRIKEHIESLRKQYNKVITEEESGSDAYKCQLCSMATLHYAPQPIYCFCCGNSIRRNAHYYCKREEEDTDNCFCATCYKNGRGGNITCNGTTVSKTDLNKKENNRKCEEAWIECSKCKRWQHQICALYNDKRDLDSSAEYVCLLCCINEKRKDDARVPFDAKDLSKTMLSDHIEERLLKRLAKIGLKLPELFVRVVLSVDKQIEVKKQFLNIFEKQDYPADFSYTSKVILLFQKIDGVDRSLYVSYLDSVKYLRPEIMISAKESLRTLVYHEILGEDYIFYCHPEFQKTPKKDQLRHWYHSVLRKAGEEDIVVGLCNMYDYFFLSTGNCESKVTAAGLPYFDGDFWSGAAMDEASQIEQCTGGDREKMLKLIPKRSLKSMGNVNLSKGTAKDILIMQKLRQTISPFKEDFMVVQLQYVCIHCHKVIECGKRWFCTECKIFQECERCHSANSHTSAKGEKHKLCEEKDIIFDNGLFGNRYNFLSFCQRNRFQFDSLRRAKYSSMMILHFLTNPTTETCSAESPLGSQKLKQIFPYNFHLQERLLDVMKHASPCHPTQSKPCTYPYCLKIRKLFGHASRCSVGVSGGCQYCKKVWQGIALHGVKQVQGLASQSESQRRAAILEDNKPFAVD